jgi:hypothetical protein
VTLKQAVAVLKVPFNLAPTMATHPTREPTEPRGYIVDVRHDAPRSSSKDWRKMRVPTPSRLRDRTAFETGPAPSRFIFHVSQLS